MCKFPNIRHHWYDIPGAVFQDVRLFFAKPIHVAKMQYCDWCGAVRLTSLDTKDESLKKGIRA